MVCLYHTLRSGRARLVGVNTLLVSKESSASCTEDLDGVSSRYTEGMYTFSPPLLAVMAVTTRNP